MPSASTLRRHTPAIAGSFDATKWAGKTLFTVGGVNATLSAAAGVYDDVLDFLHGYGSKSGEDFGALCNAALSGVSGTMTASIDSNDKLKLTHDTHTFSVTGYAYDASGQLGFATGATSSTASGGKNHVVATNDFKRGLAILDPDRLTINIDGGADVVPASAKRAGRQSLSVWVNVRSRTDTLEDAMGAGCTAYINPTGRVVLEVPYGTALAGFTADGRSLWARLGGTGDELVKDIEDESGQFRRTLTATHPCPGFLAFDKQLVEMRRFATGRDDRVVMADGSMASAGLPPLQGFNITFRAGGTALGFQASLEKALRDFWKHSRDKITFFPMWGDLDSATGAIETRKHLDEQTAYSLGVESYSATQTIEADIEASHYYKRKGGRLFLRRAPDDNQKRTEDYGSRALDVFQDVKFRLLDDPTR